MYLITDTASSGLTHIEAVRMAISAGIKIIQLREKLLSKKDIYKEALAIRTLTLRYNVTFIVNDHIDIALAVDADGVHLGQDDMPVKEARKIIGRRKIIGVSTHSLKQALDAEASGADYIGFGPIFKTATKDVGKPKGIASLKKISEQIKIPIAAIGGISHDNARKVLNNGADAIAVASGILSGDIKENVKRFLASCQ
ncbi:MAG: thiamine phosphate synthase [Nitrospirae bacterium]|nr:thiamine phosphate synthase [Nitrospirota bacterium]